jgi:N-methylhydantoinase A/oxoprolinase/acetone carboxylase beta subunit
MVTATAADPTPLPALSLDVQGRTAAQDPPGSRTADVHFAGGFEATPVVSRNELASGETRQGPMIVESMDTTIVVPPGWSVTSDDVRIVELRRTGGGSPEATAATAATAN